jgi:hypothetical protein
VEVVEDGTGEQLSERAVVATIGALECGQVSPAVSLEDNCGWIAEPDQEQIENEPASTSVTVEKWVDLLEARMHLG